MTQRPTAPEAGERPPAATIIASKLAPPPAPKRIVVRERLDRAIQQRLASRPVLIVTATAGAGKTTAVAEAASRLERPVAWLTLDWTDAQPGRLLTYIEAALERLDVRFRGIAMHALAHGISHQEAAGLLADAIDTPAVVVIDQLERLDDEPDAWAVISSFVRHTGPSAQVVLISRHELPTQLCRLPTDPLPGSLDDEALAFTVDEVAEALEHQGKAGIDAGEVTRATGGWVTGVLFEAWHSAGHVAGSGGERDPLYGYLSAQILEQISAEQREFLECTALLDDVTIERATALGVECAAQSLLDLRRAHLPVVWTSSGAMRCHPRFREYLLERLGRRDAAECLDLRRRHGRLLAAEGYCEEAVEELLAADAAEDAIEPAATAIIGVVKRLDLSVAERWLGALRRVAPPDACAFATAELLLAWVKEDYRAAVQIADRLQANGLRSSLAGESSLTAALMASAYWMGGRREAVEAVLALACPGPEVDAVRYLEATMLGALDAVPPKMTGDLFDATVLMTRFFAGHFPDLDHAPSSPWLDSAGAPWRVGALAGSGRTAEALELYERSRSRAVGGLALSMLAPDLLFDANRFDDARVALREAQANAARRGAAAFGLWLASVEIKFALRLDRDPATAHRLLHKLEGDPWVARVPHLSALAHSFRGFAFLLEDDNERALDCLRSAVAQISEADALLDLIPAAIWLSEAEWRTRHDVEAHAAADLALGAADLQDSNHLLLQALRDFPAVIVRRLAAMPDADSPWHALGRSLIPRSAAVAQVPRPAIAVRDFGRLEILIDGQTANPKISKAAELLAFLTTRRTPSATRELLLTALFEGRHDDSARAYLRQAVRRLRQMLPEGCLITDPERVAIGSDVIVVTQSTRFEAQLNEAVRLQGEARLDATLGALAATSAGPYLDGINSQWVEERREALQDLATIAQLDAASLSFGLGRYAHAAGLVERVLEQDPLRERAWRLQMRIAGSLGDEDRLLASYRECRLALSAIGTSPSAGTKQLFERLRT